MSDSSRKPGIIDAAKGCERCAAYSLKIGLGRQAIINNLTVLFWWSLQGIGHQRWLLISLAEKDDLLFLKASQRFHLPSPVETVPADMPNGSKWTS